MDFLSQADLNYGEAKSNPGMFVIDSQGTMLKNIQSLGSLGEFTPVYYGPGMFVIDSQGTMLKNIAQLFPDAILLHPDNVRLNLFQTIDADLFLYLFSAIDADLTGKQAGAIHYLLRLMQQLPQPSIQTLLDVVEAPRGKYDEPISKLDTFAQAFFERQFYGPDMKATRQQLARRLYQLLADPLFAKIFGGMRTGLESNQPRGVLETLPPALEHSRSSLENISHFDAYSLMQSGSVVLLDTSEAKLGVQASAVLGRFYIAQILAAAYRMGEQRTLRNFLIVDECAPYTDERTEMILSKARKFGLASIWATQFLDQLPPTVKSAIYGNTSIKFVGPVSYNDAMSLAREMYTSIEFIRSMQKTEQYSEFACYIRNNTPTAVRVTVPFGVMEKAAQSRAAFLKKTETTCGDSGDGNIHARTPEIITERAPCMEPPSAQAVPVGAPRDERKQAAPLGIQIIAQRAGATHAQVAPITSAPQGISPLVNETNTEIIAHDDDTPPPPKNGKHLQLWSVSTFLLV